MTDKQTQGNYMDSSNAEERLIENVFAEVELCDITQTEQNLDSYNGSIESKDFYKYLRRHEDNIFNALFYDKEDYSENTLKERILEICDFLICRFLYLLISQKV